MKFNHPFMFLSLCIALMAQLIACQSHSSEPKGSETPTTSREITTTLLQELMKKDDQLVILDVRTPEEIAEGVIPTSIHFNFHDEDFESKLAQLDKSATIVTYCRSGGRASKTCDLLESKGFKNIFNYGGYDRWIKESN